MTEQVIRTGGKIIRLAPFNVFPDYQAVECPEVRIEPTGTGFYRFAKNGILAYDVSRLWEKRFGYSIE